MSYPNAFSQQQKQRNWPHRSNTLGGECTCISMHVRTHARTHTHTHLTFSVEKHSKYVIAIVGNYGTFESDWTYQSFPMVDVKCILVYLAIQNTHAQVPKYVLEKNWSKNTFRYFIRSQTWSGTVHKNGSTERNIDNGKFNIPMSQRKSATLFQSWLRCWSKRYTRICNLLVFLVDISIAPFRQTLLE